jgi:hypothetical protein
MSQYGNLEKINREYMEDIKLDKNRENKKINVDNIGVDNYTIKFSSDELESLKDIIHKDKQKKLKKFFWMYKQENDANEKLNALKEYSDQYLALPGHVSEILYNIYLHRLIKVMKRLRRFILKVMLRIVYSSTLIIQC